MLHGRYVPAVKHVVPSSTFLSWIFQFQGGILIESPEEVAASYEAMLKDAAKRQRKLSRAISG